jgi:hypothetical protein
LPPYQTGALSHGNLVHATVKKSLRFGSDINLAL